jgi:pyruvate dehydrogenase E2 component (dihydrolipoamide acetyltransferase)
MAVEIKIPKLGLTMTEATLVGWSIGAGQHVVQEQIVCVIETDKVTLEMTASAAGLVHPVVAPGARVVVAQVVGYIADDPTELASLQARYPQLPGGAAAAPAPAEPTIVPGDAASEKNAPGRARIPVSPAARRLSETLGIELERIAGSGPDGRIILADVQKAAQRAGRKPFEGGYEIGPVMSEGELLSAAETITIRGIRKIIARNMTLSLNRQAQLTLHTEASAVALQATRAAFNDRLKAAQPPVSYNAVIVKAAALALRRHPRLNAVVDGRQIKIWQQIHIGVAMDSGKGLIVPKIRYADTKSIPIIAGELSDLAARAEKQGLLPDELTSGTFTITNLGRWDIDHFTPINNYPESAILGVGRIVEKPWVRNGAVVAEPRLALSLTFDHRIIDGAQAAEFLKTLKDMLEETRLML